MIGRLLLLLTFTMLAACTTSPPKDPSNICSIFEEKSGWYDDAADARDEWGSPIPVMSRLPSVFIYSLSSGSSMISIVCCA